MKWLKLPSWFWKFPDYVFWLLGYEERKEYHLMNLGSQYLAFELTPASHDALLAQFKPQFKAKVLCHHVTVQFNLTDESYERLAEELEGADLQVIGHQIGKGVECLVVAVNDNPRRPDGSIYHITLSLAAGHKPKESNDLLKQQGWQSCIPVAFEAELKLLDK